VISIYCLARPKRFELLTPRFVDGASMLMVFPFLANRPNIAAMNLNGLLGFCKPQCAMGHRGRSRASGPLKGLSPEAGLGSGFRGTAEMQAGATLAKGNAIADSVILHVAARRRSRCRRVDTAWRETHCRGNSVWGRSRCLMCRVLRHPAGPCESVRQPPSR
jgi:hypothetical protein